ncbi:PE-PGRS family protein PE_PGRS3 [Mycobacterium tuberculosis]|nr:PE-PGRS family protein PE_PGRS3 [Mycobacterium tuberculosis]
MVGRPRYPSISLRAALDSPDRTHRVYPAREVTYQNSTNPQVLPSKWDASYSRFSLVTGEAQVGATER